MYAHRSTPIDIALSDHSLRRERLAPPRSLPRATVRERVEHPWDRQDGETDSAWTAFSCYRDLGAARSLDAAADAYYAAKGKLRKSSAVPGHIAKWCRSNDWVERCREWDRHRDQILQKEFEGESARRGREMAKDAMEVQGICLKALRGASESGSINPMVAVVGWDKAVKHERTARGLAGDVQELRHADPDGKALPAPAFVDPAALSLEVLKALRDARRGQLGGDEPGDDE